MWRRCRDQAIASHASTLYSGWTWRRWYANTHTAPTASNISHPAPESRHRISRPQGCSLTTTLRRFHPLRQSPPPLQLLQATHPPGNNHLVRDPPPRGVLKQYTDILLELDALDAFYCGNSRCSAFLGPADSFAPPWVYCLKCKKRTCRTCRKLHRGGRACPDDAGFRELVREQGWKKCPKCKIVVERAAGCRHMVCRCGQAWCYGCGNTKSGKSHFCARVPGL